MDFKRYCLRQKFQKLALSSKKNRIKVFICSSLLSEMSMSMSVSSPTLLKNISRHYATLYFLGSLMCVSPHITWCCPPGRCPQLLPDPAPALPRHAANRRADNILNFTKIFREKIFRLIISLHTA